MSKFTVYLDISDRDHHGGISGEEVVCANSWTEAVNKVNINLSRRESAHVNRIKCNTTGKVLWSYKEYDEHVFMMESL